MFEQQKFALSRFVEVVAERRQTGSFSDRYPLLGKMVKCPFCGVRRRQAERCCTPEYTITNEAALPRAMFARKRKISHTHSGGLRQGPVNQVHQIAIEWQADPDKMKAAMEKMQYTGPTGIESIPSLAEKFTFWTLKQERKAARRRHRLARRINFGLTTRRVK